MTIDKIIKQKRQEQGLTQEQLATLLNISPPAVNKWEKGHAYPDITLLPSLARALKTDLNTLLCFKADLSEAEVYPFVGRLCEAFLKQGFEAGYAQMKEMLLEYPANNLLILHCALALRGALASYCKESNTDALQAEIKAMLEKAVTSENAEIQQQAISALSGMLIEAAEFDEAEALLEKLPDAAGLNKQATLMNLHMKKEDFKKALTICESTILANAGQIIPMLLSLEEIAASEKRYDDAKAIAERIQAASKALELGVYYENAPIFLYAVAVKDKAEAIAALQKMKEGLQTLFAFEKTTLYKHLPTKKAEGNALMTEFLLKSLVKEKELDFIKDEKEYKKIFEE